MNKDENAIQNNDVTIPGGLGVVHVGDQVREIKKIEIDKLGGSCTIEIGPTELIFPDWYICRKCGAKVLRGIDNFVNHGLGCGGELEGVYSEDAEFEIIQPKQIENGKAD